MRWEIITQQSGPLESVYGSLDHSSQTHHVEYATVGMDPTNHNWATARLRVIVENKKLRSPSLEDGQQVRAFLKVQLLLNSHVWSGKADEHIR